MLVKKETLRMSRGSSVGGPIHHLDQCQLDVDVSGSSSELTLALPFLTAWVELGCTQAVAQVFTSGSRH